MQTLKLWAAAAAMAAVAGTAQAALISQGNGTVLDTATNLLWLQDWNVNGRANLGMQTTWADNLDFAGSSDWALPSIGEYRALFAAYNDLTQVPEFTNVQYGVSSDFYWSDTENLDPYWWWFSPGDGSDGGLHRGNGGYAVAVRPADVTAPVPEPQTLALALLALGAALAARRRQSTWSLVASAEVTP